MVELVKPNIKKLKRNIENQEDLYNRNPQYVSYEYMARAYMYLGEFKAYIDSMERALAEQERQIKIRLDSGIKIRIASAIHTKANFQRLLFKEEESRNTFIEARDMYKECLPDDYDKDLDRWYTPLYRLSTVEFHLGNYEKSVFYFNQISGTRPVAGMISEAILDNNNRNKLERIIEIIKKDTSNVPIGMENGGTTALWDFYEICLQLLGLPSVLDEIREYIEKNK